MRIIFRVDASIQTGSGHVMRCLTLADALSKEGAKCIFIGRQHRGNMLDFIQSKGYDVVALPADEVNAAIPAHSPRQEYLSWLGSTPDEDARQTIAALQSCAVERSDWLIVDHYALDRDWERQIRPCCQKIMVIDDLADRPHDADLLLDPTFGRDECDYQELVPDNCTILTGSYYALLRPEFAQWREYSLQRRQRPQLKRLLVTLGGVDKDNATGQILKALSGSNLPEDCQITVVMGEHAPWLESVIAQAKQLPWPTEVKANVANMAELMANSDLCIGAAGSTTWERCCLGLPTIMIVLTVNQRKIADELRKKIAAHVIYNIKEFLTKFNEILDQFSQQLNSLAETICDGIGAERVKNHLIGGPFVRKMTISDLNFVLEWRNHPSVRSWMFNQKEITTHEHKKWFIEKSNKKEQYLLIFENKGLPQGFVSFVINNNVEADWGFYKAPDSPKGTGMILGKKAIDYAFKKIGVKKINAKIIKYNLFSIKFHKKLGFNKDCIFTGKYFDGNRYHDFFHFSISNQ